MLGERLERARFTPGGVADDRALAVTDAQAGTVLSAKRIPALLQARAAVRPGTVAIRLPDERVFYAEDATVHAALSEWLERPVRLARTPNGTRPVIENEEGTFLGRPGGFFDSAAVHIVTTSTLERLRELSARGDFDARRFRPNLLVDCDDDGFAEQAWVGRIVRIGDAELQITKACRRCALTTRAQDDLPDEREILRTVATKADNITGVYARVSAPGVMNAGDELHAL